MKNTARNTSNSPSSELPTAIRQLNRLSANHAEQWTDLQLTALQTYTTLGVNALKAASEVKTPNDLKVYFAEQPMAIKAVGEQLSANAQAAWNLQQGFVNDVAALAQRWNKNAASQAA